MDHRIGIVSIIIENPAQIERVNHLLTEHAAIIAGRMGLPNPNGRKINVIAIIVDGTNDDIGNLSGKLGRLEGVSVKSAVSKQSYPAL
jgi:putative iron-only hydrogenase system regulator